MEIISHLPERSNYKRSGPGSNCFNYAESQQFYGFETAKLLETMHSIHCHQLTLAMLHGFPRHLHSHLRGKNETIAQRLGSRQSFARFLRRVFGGDGLLGTEGDDADVPLALFFGNETRERADRVFADDVGCRTVILGAPAAPEIDDVPRALFFHERDHIFGAKKGSAQIGLNHAVPEILAEIAHARPAWNAPVEMRHDAGVVDQSIDAAEAVCDGENQTTHVLLVAHVGGHGDRFAI